MSSTCVLAMAVLTSASLSANTFGAGFSGYTIAPIYQQQVTPGQVPPSLGGITFNPDNVNQLIVGANSTGSGAAFYRLNLVRSGGTITGVQGQPAVFAVAPKLASGAAFGPSFSAGEVLFYSIASGSGGVDVGMIRWGAPGPGRSVDVVPETPGGLGFVPPGIRGFGIDGGLKIVTASGKFYSARYQAEPTGTYNFPDVTLRATLPVGGVEGFVYVHAGSAGFPVDSMLVAEYRTGSLAAYEVDARGDPIPSTRRVFFSGPPFAYPDGLFVDPVTGDLLVSTHASSSGAIYRISGFSLPVSTPLTSCGSITRPGFYHLTGDLTAPLYEGCFRMENVSGVHVDCRGHKLEGWGPHFLIERVNGFSIRNCRFSLAAPPGHYMSVDHAANGVLSENTFGSPAEVPQKGADTIWFFRSDAVNVVNNEVYGAISVLENTRSAVRFNRCFAPTEFEAVFVGEGSGNTIDGNVIDSSRQVYSDGAIWAHSETGLIISNNTVRGAGWGILVAGLTGASIHANDVRVPYVAFGVMWDPNLANWSDNRAVSTRTGVGPDAGIAIRDNYSVKSTFLRNQFGDSENRSQFLTVPQAQNTFMQNNFGHTTLAPDFGNPVPVGAVIDGGGNICKPPSGPYPLNCK